MKIIEKQTEARQCASVFGCQGNRKRAEQLASEHNKKDMVV